MRISDWSSDVCSSDLYGEAEAMIAGGAEYATTPTSVGGFCAMKALSTRNDEPEKASRPWDEGRDGFVMGDGAGILVIEEYERAKARGARIYAELAGFGMSGDAFHMTAPSENGEGGARCMRNASRDAGIDPSDIGYINAHGTSTPAGALRPDESSVGNEWVGTGRTRGAPY